jgi:RHS repeat-associated protein
LSVTYNIFRWYRAGWGRYSQADPLATVQARLYLNQHHPHEFAYAAANPVVSVDVQGLCSKCDTCPSGKWTVDPFGFGVDMSGWGMSAAAGFGLTYQYATYTCHDNGFQVKIKTTCALLGPIFGAGVGLNGPGKACGCSVADLLHLGSAATGTTSWIGPGNVDITKCTDNDPTASSGGFGKTWGAGWALTWCWSEKAQ